MARISITSGSTAGSSRRAATHYGVREHEDKYAAAHSVEQGVEVQEVVFAYDDLPAAGLDQLIQRIPDNSRILEASLHVITAFAGGTSLAVGLQEEDGTEIDNDGLITDANAPLANIDAIGDVVDGTGALVGVNIGTAAGQIVVTATGAFTAGKAMLYVKYQRLFDRAELNE